MNSLSQDFLEDFPRKSQPEACETMGSGFERRGGGNARSPPLGDSESPDVDSMPRQKVTTPSGEGRWEFALGTVYPVLSGKLALAIFSSAEDAQQAAKEDQDHIYFTTGLHDGRFSTHFGPCDLGVITRFCRLVDTTTKEQRSRCKTLVYFTDERPENATNAAFLLASYLVLAEDVAPEQAALPLLRITPSPFLPYRDASDARSDFGLNILDCLKGLARGARKGWFDWRTFDVEAFDAAAELGFSIVCPKFVALQSPYTGDDAPAWARVPDVYVRAFNCTKLGVRAVVRLCSPDTYPHKAFEEHSIAVHDLDLHNASVPSADITKQFFRLVKQSEGAIAVHCRAGLGRTGTLVALWLMFQYDWKARETIAWLRLVRPGSVIGEQQHFLTVVEAALGPGGSGLTSAFRSWRRFEEQRAASVGGSRGVDARGLAAMVAQEAMQRRISKMGQNAGSPSANGSNGSPGRRSWGSPAGSVGRRQSCSASPQGVAWSPSPGSSPLSAASPLLSREQRGHALQGIGRSERRLIRELSALLEGPDEDLDSAAAEAAAAHRRERQQAASPRPGSGAAARLARGRSLIEFRVLSARAQRSQSRDASSRGSCDSPVATGGRGADAEGASEAGGGTGDADGGAPWPSSWWSTLASRGEGRPSLPTSGVMG